MNTTDEVERRDRIWKDLAAKKLEGDAQGKAGWRRAIQATDLATIQESS